MIALGQVNISREKPPRSMKQRSEKTTVKIPDYLSKNFLNKRRGAKIGEIFTGNNKWTMCFVEKY